MARQFSVNWRQAFFSLRQAFLQPSAVTMFFFGAASGLPFLLVGGTLSAWLKEGGVSLQDIGLFSLIGLAYSLKFLWAPVVDRVPLPLLRALGQRRSWLLLAQCTLILGLIGMSIALPAGAMGALLAATGLAALAGATIDVVVDAYRVEIAPPQAQGALAATSTFGYRLALLASGALALWLADHVPWPMVYQGMAVLALALIPVTLLSPEPAAVSRANGTMTEILADSVVGPFRDFFQRHAAGAVVLLVFMGLFKLPDQMIGAMAFPFYLDCGFSKTDIAAVSKLFGVLVGIAGAFAGAAVTVWYGLQRSLRLAILLGGVSNLLFLLLAQHPGDMRVFVAVITGENLAGGFLGTVAVAWISSLVSHTYTATQYALLSSLVTLPGKLLGGFSGYVVHSIGYDGLFIFSALSVLPALLLCSFLPNGELPTEGLGHDARTNSAS